jgi:hypothetical protein
MAFIGYSIWCELARGVDPGIGDMWKIPLVNGYSLVAIDLPSQAYIQTSSGDQIFFELTAIGRKGTFLFGMVQNKALYFVINTSIGSTELFKSEQAFHDKSKLLGINTFEMEPPEKFYFRYRWGVADLIAALVIVSIPFSVFIIWRRRKIKLLKSV